MKNSQAPFHVLIALLFWLPLPLGSNRDWAWLGATAVVLGLSAWVALRLATGQDRPTDALAATRLAFVLMGGWLIVGMAQWLPLPMILVEWLSPASTWPQPAAWWFGGHTVSVDPYRSLLVWLQSVGLAALFFLVLQLVDRPRRVTILVGTLVLAGAFQAVYGGFMTLSGLEWSVVAPKVHGRGVATGTFVNRNHLAGFLVLCLAIGTGYLLGQMRDHREKRDWRQRLRDWARTALGPKMRLRLALAVMVIGLVLTRSRMGNASLFAGLLMAGLLGLWLLRRAPRPMLTLVISLLIIDLAIIGTWFGVEQVVDRIQHTAEWSEQQARYRDQDRLDIDTELLAAWPAYPWLGSGGGTFYTVFPAYRQSDIGNTFDHAHNDYLEVLLEYGVIGGGLIGGFWLLGLAAAVKAQRLRRNPMMRGIGFGAAMASLCAAVHATVDFNLHIPAYAFYFVAILALGWVGSALPSRRRHQRPADSDPVGMPAGAEC